MNRGVLKAVLFDFDGVVLHSTPVHLDGWDQAYRRLFQAKLNEDQLQNLVGRSTEAIATILAQLSGDLSSKKLLIQMKARYVLDHLPTVPLIPGIREFMEGLKARQIPYGIVSNAPRNFIENALRKHELACEFFLGLEDYLKPKPDAEPYLKGGQALQRSKDDHEEVAVFEDSAHGIEAALAAGMTAIGICSQRPVAVLTDAGARLCYPDFSEYEEILDLFANDLK